MAPTTAQMRSRDRQSISTAARLIACATLLLTQRLLLADEPAALHVEIDKLVADANSGVRAPSVDDAEFARRASLDLTGIPPTSAELREFLPDPSPGKRAALVDRLLNHPRYARHMAEVFDVMLMERRPAQNVTADEWHQYLLKAFRENRPYNDVAKEILGADGADPNPRAAVRFYLDRQADPNLLTRDVGRIFFGRDFQCAQCHDHPLIADYHQADYHGLLAFFSSGAAFTAPAPDGKTYYAEKAGAEMVFESVFVKGEKHKTGAKLPGMPELEEPALYPDEQYTVKPTDNVRPIPKFSRRSKLAELATNGSNRAFNENVANRLWAHMMGRGLVDPVDLHHSGNPPTNPALLRMLGERFAAGGFNVKDFLRELALTETYQRSIEPPPDPISFVALARTRAQEFETRLQQLTTAAAQAEEQYAKAVEECCTVDEAATPVATELEQATAAATDAAAKLEAAKQQLAAVEAQVAAKAAVTQVLADAVAKTQEVAKALPQDQELIQAAQKFAERQQQVTAEVATLTEDAKQKTAAVSAPAAAVAATRQVIDAVRVKLAPLAEAIKQRELVASAARQAALDQSTERAHSEEQLDAAKQLAELNTLRQQIAAAKVQTRVAEAAVVMRQADAQALKANLAARYQARLPSVQQVQQAAAPAHAAQAELDRFRLLASTLEKAIAETDAAKQLAPEDANLTQALASLIAKREDLKPQQQAIESQFNEAQAALQAARQRLSADNGRYLAALVEMAGRRQNAADAELALDAARREASIKVAALGKTLDDLQGQWTKSFAMLPLKPLTPEQMCWSIFQVTGVYEQYMATEQAELDKTAPLSEADKQDPAKVAARDLELQQRVYDKLKANIGVFASLYAPSPGQPQSDFFATANQALFAANGGSLTAWAAPAGGNVTERMIQQADPKAAAEDLYLTVLGRMPREVEVAEVTEYLSSRPEEKASCAQELVWGLLTSVEFRFNH